MKKLVIILLLFPTILLGQEIKYDQTEYQVKRTVPRIYSVSFTTIDYSTYDIKSGYYTISVQGNHITERLSIYPMTQRFNYSYRVPNYSLIIQEGRNRGARWFENLKGFQNLNNYEKR